VGDGFEVGLTEPGPLPPCPPVCITVGVTIVGVISGGNALKVEVGATPKTGLLFDPLFVKTVGTNCVA
jgi:hypothetical protein